MGGWFDWIDWGDAPTWCAGVFAAGAAFHARGTLKSQQAQIREQRQFIAEQSANLALERRELRAVAEDRKWAQAKQVSMTFRTAGFTGQDGGGGVFGYDHWWVTVRNSSDAPVRDVKVRFGGTYDAAEAVERESQHLPDGGRRALPVPADRRRPHRMVPLATVAGDHRRRLSESPGHFERRNTVQRMRGGAPARAPPLWNRSAVG